MNLPRRLAATALADVLDRLHRARVSGTLALHERAGARRGGPHAVHLWEGEVVAIESPGDRPPPAGDAPARLARLAALPGLELSFHPPRPSHPGPPRGRAPGAPPPRPEPPPRRREALSTLGLPPDASLDDARRAFRRWALCLHPDRHPDAPPDERRTLAERFARVARAYDVLRDRAA
ncbi:MAG TPA: J domain-containing protein [Polyangiaceae bacterium]|nr:J domain-containing protein [Polyangiaceae bacterium]